MKIKFDYTKGITDEVALIPASLAQAILQAFTNTLKFTNPDEIVRGFSESLRNISYAYPPETVIEKAIAACKEFAEGREFITKILDNKDYDPNPEA